MSDLRLEIRGDPSGRVPDGTKVTLNIPNDKMNDDEFINQTLHDYVDSAYGPENPVKTPELPPDQNIQDINAPGIVNRATARVAATMPKEDDTGFFSGLQRGAMSIINPLLHPTQMIPPQYSNMAAEDKAAGGSSGSMARMQGNPVSRAAAGDYPGLAGEALPQATLAALGLATQSPKMRAMAREGFKGAAKSLDPTGLRGKLALVGVGGGGYGLSKVGKIIGEHLGVPGAGELTGAVVGAGLPMAVGGIKGAVQGFRSAPWMPPTPEMPPPITHPSNIPLSNSGVEIRGGRSGFPIVSGDESTPRTPSMQPIQPDLYGNMGGAQIVGGPNFIGDTAPMPSTQPYGPNAGVETMGGPRGNIMTLGPDDPIGYQPPKIQLVPSYEGSQIYPHLNDIIRELDFRANNPPRMPITDQKIMRDVRRNFYQAADAPDAAKSPAPNDLKEKKTVTPEKKQFSAEKTVEPPKKTEAAPKTEQKTVTPPKPKVETPKPTQKPVTPPKKKTAPDPKDVVAGIDKELKTKAADPKKSTTTTPSEEAIKPNDPNQITSPETAPLKDRISRADIRELSDRIGVPQAHVARYLIKSGFEVEESKFDNWGLGRKSGELYNLDDPKYKKQIDATTKSFKKKGS